MEIRKSSVKALIAEQFPWANPDTDIVITDNTNWYETPHWNIVVMDDDKEKEFNIMIEEVKVNYE